MNKNFLILIALLFTFSFVVVAQPNKKQIEKANKLVREGDTAYSQKKFRAAIGKYAEALKVVPIFPGALMKKAYSHFGIQEYQQSIRDLNTSLSQGSLPIDVFKLRWLVYYNLKDYKSAQVDVEEALKIEPENAYFNIAKGDVYRGLEDYKQAAAGYAKAANLDPKNADINYYLALCYNQLRDFPKQADAAEKAIAGGTNFKLESYTFLGQALVIQRKYPEAAKTFEEILALKPEVLDTYTNLGDLYRILNRYDDAIATVRQGLRLFPKEANLWVGLSWYYSLANNHNEAVNAANEAIKFAPNLSMGHTNLCRAYNDLGQYNDAIKACDNALKIAPEDGETYLYLARSFDRIDKPEIATNMYAKAVSGLLTFTRDNPDYSDGFYLLGNAFFATNQRPKAITAYLRCLELSPNFTKARFNLGIVYLRNGDKVAAKKQADLLQKFDAALATKLNEEIKKSK
jgi:tetratricopeptide (TPR) repeat protein